MAVDPLTALVAVLGVVTAVVTLTTAIVVLLAALTFGRSDRLR